jgi:hypothetical protein
MKERLGEWENRRGGDWVTERLRNEGIKGRLGEREIS